MLFRTRAPKLMRTLFDRTVSQLSKSVRARKSAPKVLLKQLLSTLMRRRPSLVTFRMSRRRREMSIGHSRLCVYLSLAAFPHYCTDPDVTFGEW